MNARRSLLALLFVGAIPALVYAGSYNRTPSSTVATASAYCSDGTPTAGDSCWITDGNATDDCTVGGGAEDVLCWYNGAAWVSMSTIGSGGSSLTIEASGPALHYKDTDAADGDNNASAAVSCTDTGSGTEDCDYSVGVQVAGTQVNKLVIDADDELNLIGETEVEFANNATGNLDLCLSDFSDATTDTSCNHSILRLNLTDTGNGSEDADFSILTAEGGNNPEVRLLIDADGGITAGSANNNSFTVTTDSTGDGEVVLPDDSVGLAELLDDAITFAAISDSSAVDADTVFTQADGIELEFQPSYTSGDSEGLRLTLAQVDDGAATDDALALAITLASESGDAGDTIGGIWIQALNGTANTVIDRAIEIDNAETTASTMTDGILVTSSGVNGGVVDGLDVSAANITNAVNIGINPILGGNTDSFNVGATDATALFTRNDAGAFTITSADNDSTAALTVDPGGNATLTLGSASDTVSVAATSGVTLSQSESIHNNTANGTITLARNDSGTVTVTAADDDATAAMSIVAGGTATLTLGDSADTVTMGTTSGALTLGSNLETINGATNGAVTFTRNDAGTLTLTAADDDATAAITLDPGGNAALTLGSASDTISVAATAGVGLSNSESISNGTNGTLTLGRNDAGIVTVTAADDDATAALTVLPGGAAAMILGGASMTALTVTTDSTGTAEVVLPADAIGASEIDDAACTQVIAKSYNPTEAGATDDYVSLASVDTATGDASFSATESAEDQFIAPVAIKAVNLRVDIATAPGAGNDAWTITLREDGASTTLTCTIDETATNCSDASNQEAIAAGADLDFLVTSSGAASDPDANAEMRIAFCITPD
jgi:hypothetical protein